MNEGIVKLIEELVTVDGKKVKVNRIHSYNQMDNGSACLNVEVEIAETGIYTVLHIECRERQEGYTLESRA